MSDGPLDLYKFAERRGIDVDWRPMQRTTSLSMPMEDGTCCIAIDPWKAISIPQETVLMASWVTAKPLASIARRPHWMSGRTSGPPAT